MNIVPFGMAYIQVRTVRFRVYYNRLFFSAKERLTSGLSAEAELRRSGGGSLDARGGSTSLVAWWEAWLGPGGRKARMKPITYIPSCHLKLTANAPKNRQSQKETHLPTIHFRGCNQPAEYHTRINSMEDVKYRSCTSAKVPLNL